MSFKKTVLTIVVVLTIAATANATIYPAIPEPGSGGGGSSEAPILIGTHINQIIDFKNFDMMGHASSWSSGNASFNGKVSLEDGFYDSSFLYADMRQKYYGDPQNGRTLFTIMEASFYSNKGDYNLAKPNTDVQTTSNIFFPGIDVTTTSSVNNNNGTSGQFPNLYSPGYSYYVDLWVNDGTINTMNIDPHWNMDGNRLYTRFYVGINLTGDIDTVGAFTNSLEQLPEEMATQFTPVPEPATLGLLGLGSLLFRHRKR